MRKMILAIVMAGGALTPGLAWADAREDVIAGITRCAHLTDDRQWLDCYYGAAQPMRAWLGLSPAPQSQLKLLSEQPNPGVLPATATATRAAVRSGPPPMPKRSGFFDVLGGEEVVNNAPVRSYDITRDGFVITLMDGQVWQQTDGDVEKRPVRWNQPASSMRVTISRGAMHTFNLVVNDEHFHHKVRRVR